MHVISRRTLIAFSKKEPSAKAELDAWFYEAKHAEWKTPADVKAKYGNASILKCSRVVFNICGNKYRLIVRVLYQADAVYIRFVGTHEDYDKIDANTI